MGDYHDLYLKANILFWAHLFKQFRRMCLEYYKVDLYDMIISVVLD